MNWRKEMIGQLTIILLSSVQAVRISRAVKTQSVEEQHPGIYELEDTYKYTTSLNWTAFNEYSEETDSSESSYDYYDYFFKEDWSDSTSPDGHRTYSVCDANKEKTSWSDQWLRSKFIKIPSELRHAEISVQVDYAFPDCPKNGDCKYTFEVFKLERDTDSASDNSPAWSDSSYDKLKTIAAQEHFQQGDNSVKSTKETLTFKSSKVGFYIAFKTRKSCVSISRMRAFVKVCPERNIDLAVFPKTSSIEGRHVTVNGYCVPNAEPADLNVPISGKCVDMQTYTATQNLCICRDGYERQGNLCRACPKDTFRRGKTEHCRPCPDNRESFGKAAFCECKPGFRADPNSDDKKDKCFRPASAPIINSPHSTSDDKSITLSVVRPADQAEYEADTDFRYEVTICSVSDINVPTCPWTNEHISQSRMASRRFDRLEPDTKYEVTITAVNRVTTYNNNSVKKTFTTKQTPLGRVLGLTMNQSRDKKTLLVQWEPPKEGAVDHYRVTFLNSADEEQTATVSAPSFNITEIVPNKKYRVRVTPVNAAGAGKTTEVVEVTEDDAPAMTMVIAAGLGLVLIMMLVVCAILCKKGVRRNDKKDSQSGTGSTVPFLPDQTILPTTANAYGTGPSPFGAFGKLELAPGAYQMTEEKIGEGEFSSVHKGFLTTESGKRIPVAVKSLKSGVGMRYKSDFLDEGQVLNGFDHPQIIALKGVVTRSMPLMIMTEFMENGSLDNFLRKNRNGISVLEMVNILYDVASGMAYLQDKGFIHRDLAARNILIDATRRAKIADFGLGRIVEANDPNATYNALGGKIAIKWTAPEAISAKAFSHGSDVWSFGVLMWEVMSYGEAPYWDMTNDAVIRNITNGQRLPQPYGCPDAIYELMRDCWKHKQEERPGFKQLKSKLFDLLQAPERLSSAAHMPPQIPPSDSRQSSSLYTTLS